MAGHSHCAHAGAGATAWKGGGKRACLADRSRPDAGAWVGLWNLFEQRL